MPGEYTPYIGPLVPLSDEERKALVRDRLAQLDGVQNKHDVVLSDAPVDAGPLARLQLAEMHRLLAPVLEAAAFSPAHEKASDAIARLLAQWRSGLSPRVPPAQPAALATPSVTVEEVERVSLDVALRSADKDEAELGEALYVEWVRNGPHPELRPLWRQLEWNDRTGWHAAARYALSLPRAPAKETAAVEAEVVERCAKAIEDRIAKVRARGRVDTHTLEWMQGDADTIRALARAQEGRGT